jgi:glycosyltransferase involved in cell wall biosynthesis
VDHPLFDADFYYKNNPDVKHAGMDALTHFLEDGGFEGRDPNPWFDTSYYCANNPDVVKARINPLLHYIEHGVNEGRNPHPMFRASHWAKIRAMPDRGIGPLVDCLNEAASPGFHPLKSLRIRESRHQTITAQPGANLIGWPRLEIGCGEYLREVVRAFSTVGVPFGIRNVSEIPESAPGDDSVSSYIVSDCPYKTNLFAVNADNMIGVCNQLGFETVRDGFNIGMWAWELSEFPEAWRNEMSVLDEIWASSGFTQQCIARKSSVPVVYLPHPVTISPDGGLRAADFGIPENRFVFLFQFDFTGFIARKNPYASIAAFRKAFPSRNSGAVLVIKTNHSERYPNEFRALLDAVADDPDIVLIQGTFPRPKVMSLMKLADAFVSLHRAEGFGRSPAESMLLGKPVIATNYSANTEFMRQDNSCLVNYSLIPVQPGQYPFPEGQVWADPDTDHAAWHMRRLLHNRPYRQLISENGRRTIAENYNLNVTGARYLERLRLLGLL